MVLAWVAFLLKLAVDFLPTTFLFVPALTFSLVSLATALIISSWRGSLQTLLDSTQASAQSCLDSDPAISLLEVAFPVFTMETAGGDLCYVAVGDICRFYTCNRFVWCLCLTRMFDTGWWSPVFITVMITIIITQFIFIWRGRHDLYLECSAILAIIQFSTVLH